MFSKYIIFVKLYKKILCNKITIVDYLFEI